MIREYPKLMTIKNGEGEPSPEECIVFFSSPASGMVVHSTMDAYPFGMIYHKFNPDDFTDVTDDIVVWLTEGPQEPIQEAIEVVEKMRALKQVNDNSEQT